MKTGRTYVVHEPFALLDSPGRRRVLKIAERKAARGNDAHAYANEGDCEGKGKEKEVNVQSNTQEGPQELVAEQGELESSKLGKGKEKEKEKGGEQEVKNSDTNISKEKEKEKGGQETESILERQPVRMPILVYLPGRNETAWYAALKQTRWRKLSNVVEGGLLVVYGQARGDLGDGDREAHALTNWDTVYSQHDLVYVSDLLDDIAYTYPDSIDHSKVFLLGYGSGGTHTLNPFRRSKHSTIGMLSFNLTVEYGGILFVAVCNYMRGVQLVSDVEAADLHERGILDPRNAKNKCPVCLP